MLSRCYPSPGFFDGLAMKNFQAGFFSRSGVLTRSINNLAKRGSVAICREAHPSGGPCPSHVGPERRREKSNCRIAHLVRRFAIAKDPPGVGPEAEQIRRASPAKQRSRSRRAAKGFALPSSGTTAAWIDKASSEGVFAAAFYGKHRAELLDVFFGNFFASVERAQREDVYAHISHIAGLLMA